MPFLPSANDISASTFEKVDFDNIFQSAFNDQSRERNLSGIYYGLYNGTPTVTEK